MAERVLVVNLGIDATTEDVFNQMLVMKKAREEGLYENVVCTIRGYADDRRELYEIPEVRDFCRHLVGLGFISYLDLSTIFNPATPQLAKRGWGAAEVWLCGQGQLAATNPLTKELLDELR